MTKNNSFNTISYNKSFRKVFLFFLSILILALFLCSSIVYYLSVQIGTDSIGLSSISETQSTGTLSLLFWVKALTILGFLLISCLSVVFYLRFMSMFNKKLLDIQKGLSQVAIGNLPVLNTDSVDEFSVIDNELKLLVNNLQNVKSFALDVGKGNYDSQVVVFNNVGDLGSALAEMKGSLKEISEQDKIRNWTSDGLAKFADLFRNNNHDLQELCSVFLRDLIKYINANQGAVYVLEEQNGTKVLEMKACYAYGRKKHLNSTLMLGEGLAGQAVLEKETIYVTEVPSNYFKVTSGMGEATPRSVLIVPLIINEREIGVVELASLY